MERNRQDSCLAFKNILLSQPGEIRADFRVVDPRWNSNLNIWIETSSNLMPWEWLFKKKLGSGSIH